MLIFDEFLNNADKVCTRKQKPFVVLLVVFDLTKSIDYIRCGYWIELRPRLTVFLSFPLLTCLKARTLGPNKYRFDFVGSLRLTLEVTCGTGCFLE